MKKRYYVFAFLFCSFFWTQSLIGQENAAEAVEVLTQNGKMSTLNIGEFYNAESIKLQYYLIKKMIITASINDKYEIIVDDENDRISIYSHMKVIAELDPKSKYAFYKDKALIIASKNTIKYSTLPGMKIEWYANIDEDICEIDCFNGPKPIIYVGTKEGSIYCFDEKGKILKKARVFEEDQTSIMVTSTNKIITIGRDSYKSEMKVISLLDERYSDFVDHYEESDSSTAGEKYIQRIILENNYGMEYSYPFITKDYLNHRFFLMYLGLTRQIVLYDSLENSIVTNTSLEPEGVIAGFCGDKIVISDFIYNTIRILDTKLNSIMELKYSCGEMPDAYNISSIQYINGIAKMTFSKTTKYWK